MGRHPKPITTPYPRRALLAEALRSLQAEAGLTFEAMAGRPLVTVSAATLKRAAAGEKIPKVRTVMDYAAACGADLIGTEYLLRLRTRARIEERGILPGLRAPKVELIADRADLALAFLHAYEAAGAPTLREIQEASGNPHALPLSTIGRIIARETIPADEKQLVAFLHGCGVRRRDGAWRKAWAKATTPHEPPAADSYGSAWFPAPGYTKVAHAPAPDAPDAANSADTEQVLRQNRNDWWFPELPSPAARRPEFHSLFEAFSERVAAQGGVVLGRWHGLNKTVRVRCAAGHLCIPRPINVLRGRAICAACAPRPAPRASAPGRQPAA